MLSHILSSLKAAQQANGIAWVFQYCDSTIEYNAVMKIPIHFVMGDTEGHDKLVGKYTCSVNFPYICRYCDCHINYIDNVYTKFKLTLASTIDRLFPAKSPNNLKVCHITVLIMHLLASHSVTRIVVLMDVC